VFVEKREKKRGAMLTENRENPLGGESAECKSKKKQKNMQSQKMAENKKRSECEKASQSNKSMCEKSKADTCAEHWPRVEAKELDGCESEKQTSDSNCRTKTKRSSWSRESRLRSMEDRSKARCEERNEKALARKMEMILRGWLNRKNGSETTQ
jgi:hypothetical protein